MDDLKVVSAVKEDLKSLVQVRLGEVASPLFVKRALAVIEQSRSDRASLLEASDKIGRLTALFIDTDLAEIIFKNLKMKIEKAA
jgi:hypothetical protein